MDTFLVVVGVFNILQNLVLIGLGLLALLALYLQSKNRKKGGKN